MTLATEAAPSERQLRYLRALAGNTGTTFEYPATRAEASRQITRLRAISAAPRERNDEAGGAAYATAVRDEEVDGYGSSATWRVAAPPPVPLRSSPRASEHVELARYTARGEERVLRLGRVEGIARIDDRPVSGRGRVYLVERDFQEDEPLALDALIADYLAQAQEFDRVPMAGDPAAGSDSTGGIRA